MKEFNASAAGIKYVLEKKGWMDVPASGVSMYPLIKKGDICRFIALDPDHIRKGDIILFLTNEGRLVGHRYYRSFIRNRIIYHTFRGDTNAQFDSPVMTGQCIGKLTRIKKGTWVLNQDGMLAKGWGRLVLIFPAFPRFCKRFLSLKNRFKFLSKEHPHASN